MLESAEIRNRQFRIARKTIRRQALLVLFSILLFILSIILFITGRESAQNLELITKGNIAYGVVVRKEKLVDLGGVGIAEYDVVYGSSRGMDSITFIYPYISYEPIKAMEGALLMEGIKKALLGWVEGVGYKRNAVEKGVGDAFALRVHPIDHNLDRPYFPSPFVMINLAMLALLIAILALVLFLRALRIIYINHKLLEAINIRMPIIRIIFLKPD